MIRCIVGSLVEAGMRDRKMDGEVKQLSLFLRDGTLIEVTADPEFEIDLEVYP